MRATPAHAPGAAEWSLATSEEDLGRLEGEWDALAVAAGRPYCCPAWMRAWWRAAAPRDARLCVVAVREQSHLVGLAPFYTQPGLGGESVCRLLCAGMSTGLDILARAGSEEPVASAVALALHGLRPRVGAIALEGLYAGSPWPSLLAGAWPGRLRPRVRTDLELPSPTIDLAGGFDAWLSSRARSFRRELLRLRRRWSDLGAVVEQSPAGRLAEDVRHLERLHLARWLPRGGSSNIDDERRAMLLDVGRGLAAGGRFRLWTIRVGDEVAAAELFVAAGGVVAAWGGGFSEQWQSLAPSIVAIAAAAEDAAARGDTRLELGEGEEPFKLRLGDELARVAWTTVYPRTPRYPLTRVQLVPRELRYGLRRRLSPRRRAQLKRLLSRRGSVRRVSPDGAGASSPSRARARSPPPAGAGHA